MSSSSPKSRDNADSDGNGMGVRNRESGAAGGHAGEGGGGEEEGGDPEGSVRGTADPVPLQRR